MTRIATFWLSLNSNTEATRASKTTLTAVLLSAGRLALLQISEGERAIDRFVAAIVDEDGGDKVEIGVE